MMAFKHLSHLSERVCQWLNPLKMYQYAFKGHLGRLLGVKTCRRV
jgi:hypothetical protein